MDGCGFEFELGRVDSDLEIDSESDAEPQLEVRGRWKGGGKDEGILQGLSLKLILNLSQDQSRRLDVHHVLEVSHAICQPQLDWELGKELTKLQRSITASRVKQTKTLEAQQRADTRYPHTTPYTKPRLEPATNTRIHAYTQPGTGWF